MIFDDLVPVAEEVPVQLVDICNRTILESH
jgi:hypothetical protein